MVQPQQTRKRPCRICRKWFIANPRLGKRQQTCGYSDCKRKWHIKKCAEWNNRNREYFKSSYLDKKLSEVSDDRAKLEQVPVERAAVTKPRMNLHLPRKEIQEIIGIKQLVIIEYIAQLLLRRVQEVMLQKGVLNQ